MICITCQILCFLGISKKNISTLFAENFTQNAKHLGKYCTVHQMDLFTLAEIVLQFLVLCLSFEWARYPDN